MEQENISPIDAQQPIEPVKQSNWLILVTVFLIAVLLSSVGIYYFLSQKNQNQNPVTKTGNENIQPTNSINSNISGTEGWKTYLNDYFSINYPSSWELKDSKNLNFKTELVGVTLTDKNTAKKEDLEMLIFVIKPSSAPEFSVDSFNNKVNFVLDGVTGTRSSGYSGVAGTVYKTVIQVEKNSLTYYFLINNYGSITPNEVDKILFTFKFTDQTQPTNTRGSVNDAAYSYGCQESQKDHLSLQMAASKKWEPDAVLVAFVEWYNSVVTGAHGTYYIYASSHVQNYLVYDFGAGGAGGPCIEKTVIPTVKSSNDLDNLKIVSSQLPLNNPLTIDQVVNSSFHLQQVNSEAKTITDSTGKQVFVDVVTYNGQLLYSNHEQWQVNNSKKLGLFSEVTFMVGDDTLHKGSDVSFANRVSDFTTTGFATVKPDGSVMSFKKY